jgi:hypothetical protein
MAMVRVWNITDGGRSGAHPHNRMILGKAVKPGQAVQVDEARLMIAKKVHKDVESGILYVGPRPPAWYLKVKKPPKAVLDGRRVDASGKAAGKKVVVAKGHARVPAEAIAADSEKAIKDISLETPEEEVVDEEKAEEEAEGSNKSRRGRNRRR